MTDDLCPAFVSRALSRSASASVANGPTRTRKYFPDGEMAALKPFVFSSFATDSAARRVLNAPA